MVIVMFCGPNYGSRDRKRIRLASRVARWLRAPLVVCGDSNYGEDVGVYSRYAKKLGVRVVHEMAEGGHTMSDAEGAARLVEAAFKGVRIVIPITHWYHVPRASIALFLQLRRTLSKRFILLTPVPVLADWRDGLSRLCGEAVGCLHYLQGKARRPYGPPKGKPEEEAVAKRRRAA